MPARRLSITTQDFFIFFIEVKKGHSDNEVCPHHIYAGVARGRARNGLGPATALLRP